MRRRTKSLRMTSSVALYPSSSSPTWNYAVRVPPAPTAHHQHLYGRADVDTQDRRNQGTSAVPKPCMHVGHGQTGKYRERLWQLSGSELTLTFFQPLRSLNRSQKHNVVLLEVVVITHRLMIYAFLAFPVGPTSMPEKH